MAITLKEIMELNICKRLKLLGGKNGLDSIVTWPFIKNMDTISEWTHGGEMVFIIGAKEDVSEKGLLDIMKEAKDHHISGVVMLNHENYIKKIPKSVIRYADEHSLPLFRMPFVIKLIDITREISELITVDAEYGAIQRSNIDQSILQVLLSTADEGEKLAYCRLKIQPLIVSDQIRKTEYVKTLQYYLEAGNDLVKASQAMFIHRNTMVNRIRSISALLNTDVNEVRTKYELYTIYEVLKYYGKI